MIHEITVKPQTDKERADTYLARRLNVSRSTVARMIKEGLVSLEGETVRGSDITNVGDTYKIKPPLEKPVIAPSLKLDILYQDNDVMVINKPAGISVHGGNGRVGETTIADSVRPYTTDTDEDRPGIVHRLDRETSGLLVLALSNEAKVFLQNEWKERRVDKRYVALVVGHLTPPEAIISRPLDRDPNKPTRRRIDSGGRPAITKYNVMQSFEGYDLIEAFPQTGRTHQIRVHMASVGHPIAADIVYGGPKRQLGLKRQFLHASHLSFMLPSGKNITIESPLPNSLLHAIKQLEQA